jgi:hypothetical protein
MPTMYFVALSGNKHYQAALLKMMVGLDACDFE